MAQNELFQILYIKKICRYAQKVMFLCYAMTEHTSFIIDFHFVVELNFSEKNGLRVSFQEWLCQK